VRGNLRGAGDEHRNGECKKGSLCEGPACEELNYLVHGMFATLE
jgi:hypothetical protein